jgi:chloramphenicol-sensitive protein RarD
MANPALSSTPAQQKRSGLPMAVAAYVMWGLLPLYLILARDIPAIEFVGWRVVFTLPVCLLIVAFRRQAADVIAALRNPRVLGLLAISALLIGGNWLVYVVAIQQGQIFAASLGYYINPLVNVLLGTLFLGERLSRLQWLAVALAGAGVALLAWEARDMLVITLALAFSFAFYGLVRKVAPVGALPGLTIETALLLVPAIAIIAFYTAGPAQSSFGYGLQPSLVLAASGVVTAVPLLLFAVAARRMDYSSLGFVQFIAPTIVFIVGLTAFDAPLRAAQLACFVAIWTAIALFVWDLWARRERA